MKTLKKFEFKATSGGFGAKYPWDQMLDGGIHQMVKGEDYDSDDDALIAGIKTAGRKRGKHVKVQKVDGGLVLQATEADEETKAKWAEQIEAAKERNKERAKAKREAAKNGDGE